MAYKIERIVEKDNEDPWFPKQQGRWEVRDDAGKVIYKFKWWFTGDRAEWDDREFWDGPMVVRISTDGKWVECVYQTGVQHGIAFEGTLGEKIERHPLPPA
ncbi:MAG: hypothetical protein H6841_06730 [Planctomycetes bacterium]|nr:hypothetical protein [Planctomycetota bacterium]MCB9935333.1 hypothetical protein [Planctomycetota bacterium]